MQSKTKKRQVDITKFMVYIIFVFSIAIFAIWLGEMFFSVTNLLNIIRQTASISVMAVGMTFVLAKGGIDLTISGIVPTAGLISALILNATNNIFLGIAAPLVLGAVVGAVNGFLITFFTIPPFLVTLGMQGIFIGVSMWISNTKSIPIYNEFFNNVFGYGNIGGIPVLFLVLPQISVFFIEYPKLCDKI